MNRSVSKTNLVEHTAAVLEKYGILFGPGSHPDAKGQSGDDMQRPGQSGVHPDAKGQSGDDMQRPGQGGPHPEEKGERDNRHGHKPWIAGVSGGPDSMVLLKILSSDLKIPLIAAHVNYGKRGADSDADEGLVRAWCKQHAVPLEVYRVKDTADIIVTADREDETGTGSSASGRSQSAISGDASLEGSLSAFNFLKQGNFQDKARKVRRVFLTNIMKKHQAQGIFLAHHRDDLIETILLKILRGASLEKWTGIKAMHFPWIRPLLDIRKEDILDYAGRHNIPFRIDASNNQSEYARNMLRNEVFPRIGSFFPGWQLNIIRASQSAQLHQSMLDYVTDQVTASIDIAYRRMGLEMRVNPSERASGTTLTKVGKDLAGSRVLDRALWLELPEEMRIPVARNWITAQTGYYDWKRGEVDRLRDLAHIQTGKSIPVPRGKSIPVTRGKCIWRDRNYFVIDDNPDTDVPHSSVKGKNVIEYPAIYAIEYPVICIGDIYIYMGLSDMMLPEDVASSISPGEKSKVTGPGAVKALILQSNENELQSGLLMEAGRFQPGKKTGMLQLGRKRLPDRLILRYWKNGDRIRPFGMKGEQSVARHLANRRIPSIMKKRAIVLVSFDGMILAVIFPHPLQNGEMGTISEYARCQKNGEKTLTITQKHKHS